MRLTQEIIKWMVEQNIAEDITNAPKPAEEVLKIAFSVNTRGYNGMVFKGLKSGKIYACTKRCQNMALLT